VGHHKKCRRQAGRRGPRLPANLHQRRYQNDDEPGNKGNRCNSVRPSKFIEQKRVLEQLRGTALDHLPKSMTHQREFQSNPPAGSSHRPNQPIADHPLMDLVVIQSARNLTGIQWAVHMSNDPEDNSSKT
jgi:hypothetical protein